MKRFRLLALTALIISVQLVSIGCQSHIGNLFAQKLIGYSNEKDQDQVVYFEAATLDLRSWWKGLPPDIRPAGEYLRGDAKEWMAGPYRMEADAYILGAPRKGSVKELRFSIEPDLSLRDERGGIWRRGTMARDQMARLRGWSSSN